jgi:signal peptidase
MLGLTLLLVGGMTAAMVGPAGQQEYGVVSAEFESERPTVIPMGESNTVPYPVGNGGVVPVYAYVEPASEGVAVEPERLYVRGGEVRNASVTLSVPPQTGYYRRFVVQHRYLALLPVSVIDTLYEIHPWAPIVALDLVVGGPYYLLGLAVLGRGRIRQRRRETKRRGSLVGRLRNWFGV